MTKIHFSNWILKDIKLKNILKQKYIYMYMKNIYDYSLYLLDLDGTLINSELLHYKSYKLAIEKYNINIDFEYNDYVKLLHGINFTLKTIIKSYVNDFNEFYKFKESIFESLKHELQFIDGAKIFLNQLLEKNKKICIVTHSSKNRVAIIKSQLPLLNKIEFWVTKDICINKKPNPECFIRAIKMFNIPFNEIIAFEDSYKGFKSLDMIPITKVIIQDSNYYYYPLESYGTYMSHEDLQGAPIDSGEK